MSNLIKTGSYVVVSFVLGALGGYYLAKQQLEQDYNDEKEELRQYMSTRDERWRRHPVDGANKPKERVEDFDGMPEGDIVLTTNIKDLGGKTGKRIMNKYAKPDLAELAEKGIDEEPYDDPDDHDMDDELVGYDDDPDNVSITGNPDPYRIDRTRFAEENKNFEKITYFYYRLDKTLIDEMDGVIDDDEQLAIIGDGWLKGLNKRRPVYIRNEGLMTDVEIRSLNQSYQKDVASKIETDHERTARRDARKKAVDQERRNSRKHKNESFK